MGLYILENKIQNGMICLFIYKMDCHALASLFPRNDVNGSQ
jgi:hypothetical protein